MEATRILPDLQCSLMCEEVRQEANGNLFLIGVINFIRVPQLPIVAARLCIFNRWTAGVGQFLQSVRIIAPDQVTVLGKHDLKFGLQDAGVSATNVFDSIGHFARNEPMVGSCASYVKTPSPGCEATFNVSGAAADIASAHPGMGKQVATQLAHIAWAATSRQHKRDQRTLVKGLLDYLIGSRQ